MEENKKSGGGRRPKKKPLRGKKVGFAEKKLRLWLKMAHRVYQGEHVPTCGGLPKPTLRGSSLWLRLSPSCASGFAFRLHGEIHNTPFPMAGLLALTSPPPDFLFSSIHPKPTIPPQIRNIPYWYCPLCTPSLTLPPSSLKCLQKSNPNIHRKCFGCFKCFHPTGYYKIKTDTYSFDGVE